MQSRRRTRPRSTRTRPRVAVVGGARTLEVDRSWWPLLDAMRRHLGFDRVWHGARGGAGEGVAAWARSRRLTVVEFPAPHALHHEVGRSARDAEARRNDDMLRAWGGYRNRGGSIVPCARAGGFAELVLALPPDDDTRDLVTRAERWPSMKVVKLWAPGWRWHARGPRAEAVTLTTWGDVVVDADHPLRWAVGGTRSQLRSVLKTRGWSVRGREPPSSVSWGLSAS